MHISEDEQTGSECDQGPSLCGPNDGHLGY